MSTFRFQHRLRVRWVEVDAQQVVFNGHYLTYLDVAVSEYWRQVGLPYPGAWQAMGADIYVRRNALDYHAPARLDDWLTVGVRAHRVGGSSLTLAWEARRGGQMLVDGEVVYVCVGLHDGRPMRLPEEARLQLDAFEAGGAAWIQHWGAWDEVQEAAATVRRAVFIDEQGISDADEWDEDDARATHLVVSNLSGWPAATGRLIPGPQALEARIGRLAVQRSARGAGLGREVLLALVDDARARGFERVTLHAQCTAQALYASAGFQPVGEVFDEVGIPHQKMQLTL